MTGPGNAFLAFDPSDAERHTLVAALTEASPGKPMPGKRVRPENWHVTLRFLGPIEDHLCDRIAGQLDEMLEVLPTRVWCSGLGAFPRASRAGIVFAGFEDPDRIFYDLAETCEEAATDVGLEPEGRRFVPHLTLSRLRPKMDVQGELEERDDFRVRMEVGAVTLFRTRSVRGQVSYDPLYVFPLMSR